MHAMGGVIDMRRFGGLRHRLPYHLLDVRRRRPGPVGDLPARRLLQQGRDPAGAQARRASRTSTGWGWVYMADLLGRRPHGVHDGLLHRPGLLPDLLGPEKLPSPDDPEAPPIARRADAHAHGHGDHGARPTATPTVTARRHVGHESPPVMTYPADRPGRLRGLDRPGLPVAGPFCGHDRVVRASPACTRLGFEALRPRRARTSTGRRRSSARSPGSAGIGLSYLLVRPAEPDPGRLAEQLRPLYEASLQQVLRRRVLRAGRHPADSAIAGRSSASSSTTYLVDRPGERRRPGCPGSFGRDVLAPFQNGLIQFYAAVYGAGRGGAALDPVADADQIRTGQLTASDRRED